jgi:anti-sigma factor RsiW
VNADKLQLLRYLDGDLSVEEARAFRARLVESPALQRELAEMRRVGALLRSWAAEQEGRASDLVEPTLARVSTQQARGARFAALGYALAAALVVVLPWSPATTPASGARLPLALAVAPTPGAAIERVQAVDKPAEVFVLGIDGTPVVWLSDDAQDDEAPVDQGPG